MPLLHARFCLAFVLGLGVSSGCDSPANEPTPDAGKSPPATDSRTREGDDLGDAVERRLDEAAGGVRRAGERVEAGASKAADAIERAGERSHARVDETAAERAEAKQAFIAAARAELAKLDQALRELEADTSAAGQQAHKDLRAARDRAQHRIDELETQSAEVWTAAKTEVEQALAKLRAEIDARRSS